MEWGGTKGSDLDGGRGPGAREGEGGEQRLIWNGMERDTPDEVFTFYPIKIFFCLFVCLFGITIYF